MSIAKRNYLKERNIPNIDTAFSKWLNIFRINEENFLLNNKEWGKV